jgi:hypothetical protein
VFNYGVKRNRQEIKEQRKEALAAVLDNTFDVLEEQVGDAIFKMFLLGVAAGALGASLVLAAYLIVS